MNPETTFQSFYQAHLQDKLRKLDKKKIPALLATAYMRGMMVIFMVVFFSIWLGFVFTFVGDGPWFVKYVIGGFFVLGGFVIIFSIIRKYVYRDLKKFFPLSAENPQLTNFITAISVVIMMALAGALGKFYLGDELGGDFIFKYAGAIFFLIALVIPVIFIQKIGKNFHKKYKTALVPELLNYLNASVDYEVDEKITKPEFIESDLVEIQNIVGYEGSDLVKGKAEKTNFRFSQLEVKDRRVRRSGGKTKVKVEVVFQGLFFVADFNKNLSGKTIVMPDVARELFGELVGEKLNKLGLGYTDEVSFEQLENVEFEKFFTVYSSDPVEARFVLSPKLMEQLVELRKELNYDFSASFKGQKMYLALESTKDLFGPAVFSSIDNQKRAEEVKDLLSKVLSIPESLDLNVRIWG